MQYRARSREVLYLYSRIAGPAWTEIAQGEAVQTTGGSTAPVASVTVTWELVAPVTSGIRLLT
jgi:hypothetical protein